MSNVLVVAEILGGTIKNPTYTAITFARQAAERTGGQVHLLAIGQNVGEQAKTLAGFAAAVHVADDARLAQPTAEAYAKVIAQAAKAAGATVVAMAATFAGKDIMPRVAALLSAGMASDISGFAGSSGFAMNRAIQAG